MDDDAVRAAAGGHGAAPGLRRMSIMTDREQLRCSGAGVQLKLHLVPAHLHELHADQEAVGCGSALILASCLKSTSLSCRRGRIELDLALFVVDEQVEPGKKIFAENAANPGGKHFLSGKVVHHCTETGDGSLANRTSCNRTSLSRR